MDEDPIIERGLADARQRHGYRGIMVFIVLGAFLIATIFGRFSGMTVGAGAGFLVLGAIIGWAAVRFWASLVPAAGGTHADRRMAGVAIDGHAPVFLRDAIAPVLEGLPDPVLLLDTKARIRFANGATRQILRAALPGRHIASAIRTPSVLDAIEQVRTGEPAQTIEYTVPVPFERHLNAHVLPVRLPGDESAPDSWSILLVIRDLTAMKRLEQMRVDFIASASHELRTPLASVSGFIDTLRGHARSDPEAQERFLQIMADQVARMGRLIDDLLSLSQIELNEHVPPADLVDMHDVLRDVVDALSPLAREGSVEVVIEGENNARVLGERDELVQVFQNLVHNALKYASSGKRIEITSHIGEGGYGAAGSLAHGQAGQKMLIIRVRDYGPGIPREHIPRLTERFYRVDIRQSRRQGGTGLGLAIVKHIVNRHRGSLEILSALGEGSTFTVSLPLASDMALPEDPVRTLHFAAPVVGPAPLEGVAEPRFENSSDPTTSRSIRP